jgi:hypothetical protein
MAQAVVYIRDRPTLNLVQEIDYFDRRPSLFSSVTSGKFRDSNLN